jgi:MFS family permease
LVAIAVAPFVGRLGNRFGPRAVAVPGAVLIAAGVFFYRGVVGPDPSFWTHWLPGGLLTGAGIAATFPMISVSAVLDVDERDRSVVSATNRMALQIGNAIGIALVVAILGAVPTPGSLPDFRLAWTTLGALALGCAALTATFRRAPSRARSARAPVAVQRGSR